MAESQFLLPHKKRSLLKKFMSLQGRETSWNERGQPNSDILDA